MNLGDNSKTTYSNNLYKDTIHWIIQNRVCLATCLILWWSLVSIDSTISSDWVFIRFVILVVSAAVFDVTRFGKWTNKVYRKTCTSLKKSIELGKDPHIDERYFLQAIDCYERSCAIGYCELQWMYLAAKEYWLEDEFFELKRRLAKNKIPNF